MHERKYCEKQYQQYETIMFIVCLCCACISVCFLKLKKATNSIQEEKYLSSLVSKFKEFINSNENFTEKRRTEDVLNMIEKVVKFYLGPSEQIRIRLQVV